jgi:sulfite exporter TauE/SafE
MPDTSFVSVIGLGFLLGVRHALDADHVAAVSTLIAERPAWRSSGWIGFWWGCGHTLTLLAVGLIVLQLKIVISPALAAGLEFAVGIMLVLLGASLAATVIRDRWHLHVHQHDGASHAHLHRHGAQESHGHEHWFGPTTRPVMVGMVHGLAGSAALMLLVLAAVQSPWEGLVYILVFGAGSIAGMIGVGLLISFPLTLSQAMGRRVQLAVQGLASLASIALGVSMMVRVALGFGAI